MSLVKRLLPTALVKRALAAHAGLGLLLAAVLYVIALTGTVLVFTHDWQRWEQPQGPVVTTVNNAVLSRAMTAGYQRALELDALDRLYVDTPSAGQPRLRVRVVHFDSGTEELWLADANGGLVTTTQTPWTHLLEHLHFYLLLPDQYGLWVVGLFGILLMVLILTGVLSHPRLFRDAFALRLGGRRRLQEVDLHNRIGIWGLPFHLTIAFTGAILGLATLILSILGLVMFDGDTNKAREVISGPQVVADASPAPLPPVNQVLTQLDAANAPGVTQWLRISDLGTAGQLLEVGRTAPGQLSLSERYRFNSEGDFIGQVGYADGALGQQIIAAFSALHFGWFGGLAVKLLYGVLGAGLVWLTIGGVHIWQARQREQGHDIRHWQRLWSAVVWGQPIALAGCAILALTTQMEHLEWLYLAMVIAVLPGAWLAPLAAHGHWLLPGISAGLFALVPTLHSLIWAGELRDPVAWVINGLWWCSAALLGLTAWRRYRRASRSAPDHSQIVT